MAALPADTLRDDKRATRVKVKMANASPPAITVDLGGDKPSPPSRLRVVAYSTLGLLSLAALGVMLWKLWYCPGPLGSFSWFRCKCAENSDQRDGRRCTCSAWFNESGSSCAACGDVQQPCCSRDAMCRDRIFPLPTVHYQCNEATKLCEADGSLL